MRCGITPLREEERQMSGINEQGTSVDGLDASLDDLLKAADAGALAAKLEKAYGGVSVEHSGHDEPGKGHQSGGLPGGGDIGGIDNMMIGKMVNALSAAGYSDAAIRAFMKGKAEDEEEMEEDVADEDDEEMEMGGYKKSFDPAPFRKSFHEDPDIAEAVDAAPFMEALTARTTEALDRMHKSMTSTSRRQDKVNKAMAVAMVQQSQLIKSQQTVISELGRRLNIVESTPMPSKGHTNLVGAQPVKKSLGATPDAQSQLRKSDLASILSYRNLVKSDKVIAGEQTTHIIAKLESGGQITPKAVEDCQQWLANNPTEAEAALNYA